MLFVDSKSFVLILRFYSPSLSNFVSLRSSSTETNRGVTQPRRISSNGKLYPSPSSHPKTSSSSRDRLSSTETTLPSSERTPSSPSTLLLTLKTTSSVVKPFHSLTRPTTELLSPNTTRDDLSLISPSLIFETRTSNGSNPKMEVKDTGG